MMRLLSTTLLALLLSLTTWAQNCDPIVIPFEVPSEMCSDDDPVFLIGLGNHEVFGDGVIYEQGGTGGNGGFYFDPSLVQIGQGSSSAQATITYMTTNNCDEWESAFLTVTVTDCSCEPFDFDPRTPQEMCNTDNMHFIGVFGDIAEAYGPGIVILQGEIWFDPTAQNVTAAGMNTFTIGGFNSCQEYEELHFSVFVDDCTITGINNLKTMTLEVYPSRVTTGQLLNISTTEEMNYYITDITGSVKLSGASTGTINVSNLDAGVYFIQAQSSSNQTYTSRFLVE